MMQVWEFFRKLFDTSDFPPRWHCGYWTQFHGWLYIISDLSIWAAYFAIPVIIIRYVSRKHDTRFVRVYFLFASFILACGATHFLDAVTFWYPFYRANALLRFITGIISWVTVFSLIKLLPFAFSLKTNDQLEKEIEQRKKAEEQLKINNDLLLEAQEIAKLGHWQWDLAENKIAWSEMTFRLFDIPPTKDFTYEQYMQKLHPEDREFVNSEIMKALKDKTFPKFYHRIIAGDGQVKTLLSRGHIILDSAGDVVVRMIGTVQDVTDQVNTEHELMIKTKKLEASNIELEKFASIASHDLREPLRKIITFGSMLEKDFDQTLGEKGRTYLHKITSSSMRMQQLINNILEYSKLTADYKYFKPVKLNDVVTQVLSDMEVDIEKTCAKIVVDPLPEAEANASLLGQLFQNLLGNALKFRKPGQTPEIHIHGQIIAGDSLPAEFIPDASWYNFEAVQNADFSESERYCKIYIQDNGVGFDEKYMDKIFIIFQRLHDRSQFEGTGIGLAVCKKVVDIHHGYITAISKPGEGATFIVFLPLHQEEQD